MEKRNCIEFSFKADSKQLEENEEWNLYEEDGDEGCKAKIPFQIKEICKNMNDILISKRRIRRGGSDIKAIDFEDLNSYELRIPLKKQNKILSKVSATSTLSFRSKPLRDEIEGYLRMGGSVKKSTCNVKFNFDIKSLHVLQSKIWRSHFLNEVKDDFVTISQVQPFE